MGYEGTGESSDQGSLARGFLWTLSEKDHGFSFGNIEFKMPMKYPNGDI